MVLERMSAISSIPPGFSFHVAKKAAEREEADGDRKTACGQVSGFRGLPRGSSLWSIATLNQRESRAAAIPRNAAPLNEGEIELFQLIRLNWLGGNPAR